MCKKIIATKKYFVDFILIEITICSIETITKQKTPF